MKRQKLIDDIQKFIDTKRRKYFIIKLILAFYFSIFAISVLKLRILDYWNSFLMLNFIFIVIMANITLIIGHFKKKIF